MHKLGIGGIDFPEKHTLDEHRPNGFKIPEITYDESTAHETTTTGAYFEISMHIPYSICLFAYDCVLLSIFIPYYNIYTVEYWLFTFVVSSM